MQVQQQLTASASTHPHPLDGPDSSPQAATPDGPCVVANRRQLLPYLIQQTESQRPILRRHTEAPTQTCWEGWGPTRVQTDGACQQPPTTTGTADPITRHDTIFRRASFALTEQTSRLLDASVALVDLSRTKYH